MRFKIQWRGDDDESALMPTHPSYTVCAHGGAGNAGNVHTGYDGCHTVAKKLQNKDASPTGTGRMTTSYNSTSGSSIGLEHTDEQHLLDSNKPSRSRGVG